MGGGGIPLSIGPGIGGRIPGRGAPTVGREGPIPGRGGLIPGCGGLMPERGGGPIPIPGRDDGIVLGCGSRAPGPTMFGTEACG